MERVIGYALLAVAVMIGAEWLSTVLDVFDTLSARGFRPAVNMPGRHGISLY